MLHKHLKREREGGRGGGREGEGERGRGEKIKRERNVNKSINKKREGGRERERDLLHPVMPYTRDSMVNDQIILIAKHSRQNE